MATKNGLHVLAPLIEEAQLRAEIDLIAIHGLNGHPFHTWTFTSKKDKSEFLWLRDILPVRFPNARIMTFGYDARFIGSSTSGIEDDARDLLERIKGRRTGLARSDTPIVFIAHSLGGLVVKQALIFAHNYVQYKDVLNSTKAIMFMGTPHRGSGMATFAATLGRVMQATSINVPQARFKALQKNSEHLSRSTDFFRNLAPQFTIISCYETRRLQTLNSMVVDRESAIMGIANETLIPINGDHRSMCRISKEDDDLFGIIFPVLQRVITEALHNREIKYSLQISQQHSQKSPASVERHFIVPVAQNSLFTGRNEILQRMRDHFRTSFQEQKRVILTGLGGVGKSQIATAFAYTVYANKEFLTVFWTLASSRERLIQSFTDIAKHLGIFNPILSRASQQSLRDGKLVPSGEAPRHVEAVKSWLSAENNSDWLLIFDNVDDLESFDVSEFFPRSANGHIIITSRRQQAARFGKQIEVDTMTDDDAVEMLLRCSHKSSADMTAVRKLSRTLGNLPLALDQAGAYISEQGIDFDEYLDIYSTTKAHVLERKPPKAVWSYEQTVFTTWEISYSKLEKENELSVKLLEILGFFSFEDIPLSLTISLARPPRAGTGIFLHSFIESIVTRKDYEQIFGELPADLLQRDEDVAIAIGKLLSYSLVRRKPVGKSLSMHPLVHTWIQDRGHTEGASHALRARTAIGLVHRAMFNATDLSQFADVQVLYSHAFTCNSHFHHIPQLFGLVDAPKLAACIIAVDAWVPLSMDQGTLEKSDRFYELIEEHESTDFKIPRSLLLLRTAYRYSSMGLRKESSSLCEKYFSQKAPSDRYEAMYQACIAQMYGPSLFRRFLYDRCEAIFALSQTWCDPSNYMLARKQLVLAGVKTDRGDFQEAETLFLSCRDILQQRVGPGFFIWSVWHQMTALCYIAQERYDEAEKLIRSLVLERKSKLESRSLLFSFSDYELVEVYSRALRKLRRFEDAIVLLEDILELTQSKVAPPARALGELSLVLAQLDTIIDRVATHIRSKLDSAAAELDVIEELLSSAESIYQRAADAYEVEWTRGTWVFKFFPSTIEDLRQRLNASMTADHSLTTSHIPRRSMTSSNYVTTTSPSFGGVHRTATEKSYATNSTAPSLVFSEPFRSRLTMSTMSSVATEDNIKSKTQSSGAFGNTSVLEEETEALEPTTERSQASKSSTRVSRIQAKMTTLWKKVA